MRRLVQEPNSESHSPDESQSPQDDKRAHEAKLWERLKSTPKDAEPCEALINAYTTLVRSELKRARMRFPSHIDMDELEAAGLEGLFLAVSSFNHNLGTSFEGFARKRIWGAMIDRVRSMDGVPRTSRKAVKTLAAANNSFIQREGRVPTMEELAIEVGITPEKLVQLERQAQISNKLSLDSTQSNNSGDSDESYGSSAGIQPSKEDNPLTKMTDSETHALLVKGLQSLSERERSILVLYYHEGIMFNEIAAAMEVSESRISQIHTRALDRLKRYLICKEMQAADNDE